MSFRRNVTFLLFVFRAAVTHAQQSFTLESAISYAVKNNLQIKQAELNEVLDEQTLAQNRVSFLPVFNGTIQQSNSYGRSLSPTSNTYTNSASHFLQGSVNGQLILSSGLQKINTIAETRYQLLTDRSRTEKAKNDAILNVLTFYIQMLSSQDLIASVKEKAEVSKLQLDNDQKKLNVGTITEADLLQDKAQYAQDIQALTTYQNNLDIARTSLQQFMNLDLSGNFTVVRPDSIVTEGIRTAYNAGDVYQNAKSLLPNVKTESLQVKVYEKALAVARGGFYPVLSLGSSLSTVFSPAYRSFTLESPAGTFSPTPYLIKSSGEQVVSADVAFSSVTQPFRDQLKNNLSKYFGFTLNLPLFNSWQVRTAVRKAAINLKYQQLNEQIAATTLNKTIVQAVIDLRAADKKLQSDHSSTEALKKSFFFARQRYNVGLLNSLDFNLAKSKYTVAEATEIQDKYDLLFKAKVIDFYLGNKITL